jgi:bifunctional polynucleotide phosphatase/kinase
VHPFFTKGGVKGVSSASTVISSLTWLPSLGSKKSCLHAINLAPKAAKKVALFDLDGTLIKFDGFGKGGIVSKGKESPDDWQWWHSVVPKKLKELHDDG